MDSIRYGLSQEFFFIKPSALRWFVRLASISGLALALVLGSPFPALVGLSLAWYLPSLILRAIQHQRRKLFHKQFGAILPQISSILHAGHTFERAIESLRKIQPAPLRQELELLLKELQLGTPMEIALENLCQRFPGRDLEILARAISISRRVGSNLAEAFDRVSEVIRSRTALQNRLASLTAQGRMQAGVAIAMPFAMVAIMTFITPGYLNPFFYTLTGRFLMGVSLVFLTIGGIWVYKISNSRLM